MPGFIAYAPPHPIPPAYRLRSVQASGVGKDTGRGDAGWVWGAEGRAGKPVGARDVNLWPGLVCRSGGPGS